MKHKNDLRILVIALLTSIIAISTYHLGMTMCRRRCLQKISCGVPQCDGPETTKEYRLYLVPQHPTSESCRKNISAPPCGTFRNKACCCDPESCGLKKEMKNK